ncbi:DNA repair protein RadC [Clostridium sp. MB40-C1]|uniref:RadC family protein n=1 Tax=Clostridium sp. MB40-C1 TaxID=3070996 RepID=UPI0027DEF157|nr:DNA repair protein RadC [Clostridium sp. MB40-C1]WMJ81035.1 DNA repair protein RadC [Clostridium sp. MB40-C1]
MNMPIKINDLPKNERPRERLLRYGAEVLSNSELLAIILRTGTLKENAINLSSRILRESKGLNGILNMSSKEFMKINGVGEAKAAQLLAIGELVKRFNTFKSGENYKIKKPSDAANMVMYDMCSLKKEHLRIIMLNTKNIVIAVRDISVGSINSSIVHPREVFGEAIKRSSASIIICHNHPSGDPTPSNEDIKVTQRLNECSKLLGIDLLDHLIIGNGVYISLKEKYVL